jgi:uncharacterized protein YecE (DUF72 family)
MGDIRIGCSGWNYKHWRGPFYPDGLAMKHWFAHYAAAFDTVEINNSHYRLPEAAVFAAWRDAAPPGFVYAVKASRFLTHHKKLKDPDEPIERLLGRARHLGPTLGPLLYQLPPRWRLDLDRLRGFVERLPRDVVHVMEFRDPSWMTDPVFALLDAHGIGFCTHDMPGLEVPRAAVGPVAYVRFHGTAGKYVGRYSEAVLADWLAWMQAQAADGREVYAYFNNDIHGHAIDDALALKRLADQA